MIIILKTLFIFNTTHILKEILLLEPSMILIKNKNILTLYRNSIVLLQIKKEKFIEIEDKIVMESEDAYFSPNGKYDQAYFYYLMKFI